MVSDNCIKLCFEYLHHNIFVQPVTVFDHCLVFRWNFMCFNLCPFPLLLSVGTTERSQANSSSVLPIYIDKITPEP